MKLNRIAYFTLVMALSLSLCSCPVNVLNKVNDADFCSSPYALMTVNAEDSNSVVITIRNCAETDIGYDYSVILNIWKDNAWYDIPCIKDSYIEVLYGLSPGKDSSYEITLDKWFGPLNSGCYRIMKPIYVFDTTEYILAEFVIK